MNAMRLRLFGFAIHLMGSVALAALSLGLVFYVWYPAPLASAVGVNDVFLMMLGVDVVLGPLLTFVVCSPQKKHLVFDLAVILIIQLAALLYGLHVIAAARPAWLVFSGARFDLEQANDLDRKYIAETAATYRGVSWTGPKWVAARMPSDVVKRNELVWGAVAGSTDLPQRPDLYVSIEQECQSIARVAQPVEKLARLNAPEQVSRVLADWPEADAFMPLITKGRPLTVLLKRGNSVPLAIVDLRAF